MRQARLALAQAFIAALLARDDLAVAEENVALGATTEQIVAHQVEGGNRSAAELLSIQVNRVQYLQDEETARVAHDQALQDLAALLGLPAPAGFAVAGDLAAPLPEPAPGDAAALAEARSDVAAARHAAAAARAATALAEAQRSVDPTFGVEYQRNGPDNTFGFTATRAAAGVEQPRGGRAPGRGAAAPGGDPVRPGAPPGRGRHRQGAAGLRVEPRRCSALYSRETLDKAKRALAIATTAYQGGATSLLEVIDAQRTSNQIRVAANQALANARLALAQLEFATGRGAAP